MYFYQIFFIDLMAISDKSKSTFWLHLSEPEHNPLAFQTRTAAFVYEKSARVHPYNEPG